MPAYRVMINGQNFLVEMGGRLAKCGFFTTRIVEMADPVAAEHAAVQMIREKQRLRDLVRNDPADPPVMDVTSIVELEVVEEVESREPGFVWYEERPGRWWQFWRRQAAGGTPGILGFQDMNLRLSLDAERHDSPLMQALRDRRPRCPDGRHPPS